MPRPIGVDLFAGAGGLSLGFEQAGFDVVAAVEIDPIHAAAHSFNFPKCATLTCSVTDLTGQEIRDAAGVGDQTIDVVFGGAPCQGFSLIGQRALDDPRNALVRDFVRLVSELDANYFVFENVKGITLGEHRKFLEEVIEAFKEVGYQVLLPWQVLNASSYGVPQERERLFLMGCREDLVLPAYPDPTTRAAGTPAGKQALPEGPSCEDALKDIPDAENYDDLWESDEAKVRWGQPSAYGSIMRGIAEGANYLGHPRIWDNRFLTSSLRTEHTDTSRQRFAETAQGSIEPTSRFFKLPAQGVSNTLRAGTDSARGAFTSPRPIHYKYARCITVREMARLHGYPDWFRFHQTKWHGARQIGNSVPPPLARAVASQLLLAMKVEVERPTKALELGDPDLLRMEMSQAAAHFGVPIEIAQRTRKEAEEKRPRGRPRKQVDDEATGLSAGA
jgi:DNA (cytosine-5)-methyltransferase 1